MINLLPPEIKEQARYSKYNVALLRMLVLTITLSSLLAATLVIAHSFADSQIDEYTKSLEHSEERLAQYQDLEEEVTSFNQRLNTIDQLFDQQTRFSSLLEDLADTLPSGAYINSIVLTGDDTKPVRVTITANSFSQASLLNEALSMSERIESVDIQSISKSSTGYNIEVVMEFSEGSY
ncbi:MAG: PilN domain-containing protein [Candidatus Saccharimonadales bacterium]